MQRGSQRGAAQVDSARCGGAEGAGARDSFRNRRSDLLVAPCATYRPLQYNNSFPATSTCCIAAHTPLHSSLSLAAHLVSCAWQLLRAASLSLTTRLDLTRLDSTRASRPGLQQPTLHIRIASCRIRFVPCINPALPLSCYTPRLLVEPSKQVRGAFFIPDSAA